MVEILVEGLLLLKHTLSTHTNKDAMSWATEIVDFEIKAHSKMAEITGWALCMFTSNIRYNEKLFIEYGNSFGTAFVKIIVFLRGKLVVHNLYTCRLLLDFLHLLVFHCYCVARFCGP